MLWNAQITGGCDAIDKLAPLGLLAGALGLVAAPALAAKFECRRQAAISSSAARPKVNSLDMYASNTISTRNNAMNIFESLMTRGRGQTTRSLELAEAMTESPDHLTYTFKLRQGVSSTTARTWTTDDVVASFDRYRKLGIERGNLDNVEKWEAPDKYTFIIRMKEGAAHLHRGLKLLQRADRDHPGGARDAAPLRLEAIGTRAVPIGRVRRDSHVKFKRYEGYKPNTQFGDRTGFGGYKVACVDTVTYRIVTNRARARGLETGELLAVEDVPTKRRPSSRRTRT